MTCEPIGLIEIAALLGVEPATPKTWHSRGLMPPPGKGTVSGKPWWNKPDIVKWAKETGRYPQ